MSKLTLNEVRGLGETTYKNLPRGLASAWANLNGTGTPALRDSENVSSVVDNGTGDYTFNYNRAMTNSNYKATGAATESFSSVSYGRTITFGRSGGAYSTTSIRALTASGTGTISDCELVTFDIHGDLA